MAKNTQPKCKQCRREGEKLFLKGERCYTTKCAIVKRNYAPGDHGNKRRPRMSGYGIQLREKQKAKRQYGILEKQFRLYFERAKKKQGKTGEEMLTSLERRLDNVLYRGGFGASRGQARQLVGHGHVHVNGQPVNIPSYQISEGDVITVKEGKAKNAFWGELAKQENAAIEVPVWLAVDKSSLKITISQLPTSESINTDLKMHLIVELYSL